MRIAVLGAGLMGPAIVMDCVESDEVEEVLIIDIDQAAVDKVAKNLGNPLKLKTAVQDVTYRRGLVELLKSFDVACIALSRWLNIEAMWSAIEAGVDVVDLSGPSLEDWEEIDEAAKKAAITCIPGCGVEPGLTDMLAAYGMDMLDSVQAVNIWCGGIPQNPKPPLNYKIVFGGQYLPLQPGMVKIIEDGEVRQVKRYTLGDPVRFEGIGRPLECYYDRFPETLCQLEKFKGVRQCANKTVRYAGYCEKVNFLDECGLLSTAPVEFKGHRVVPFEVFSKIIYPKVRLEEGEKDITVLRVVVEGVKDSCETCYTFDLVDFYDEHRGITSMARTTGYAAAIVARMLGSGNISEKGLVPPVKSVRDKLFRQLLQKLGDRGVQVTEALPTST
jgi:lysine 6-dehydrogenase